MGLSRLGLRTGTVIATLTFAIVTAALLLAEYVLFVGLILAVLSVVLSYFLEWGSLLLTSAVLAVFPVCYHVYRLLGSEVSGEPAIVRAFQRTLAGVSRRPGTALHDRVDRLADRSGVPTPRLVVLETGTPITATVGYRPSSSVLFVSDGVTGSLDDRELEAVLAHELAHLRYRDGAVMTALTATWANARVHHERESALSLLTSIPGAVGRLCSSVLARSREYAADDHAVSVTDDPAALANALETLRAELERTPAGTLRTNPVLAAFSILPPPAHDRLERFDPAWYDLAAWVLGTHPPTDRRIERLRALAARPPRITGSTDRDEEDSRPEERGGLPVSYESEDR